MPCDSTEHEYVRVHMGAQSVLDGTPLAVVCAACGDMMELNA